MFKPESIWGDLKARGRNLHHLEASMLKSVEDIEATIIASSSSRVSGLTYLLVERLLPPPDWAAEDVLDRPSSLPDAGCSGHGHPTVVFLDHSKCHKLHDAYLQLLGPEHEYSKLWERCALCTCEPLPSMT